MLLPAADQGSSLTSGYGTLNPCLNRWEHDNVGVQKILTAGGDTYFVQRMSYACSRHIVTGEQGTLILVVRWTSMGPEDKKRRKWTTTGKDLRVRRMGNGESHKRVVLTYRPSRPYVFRPNTANKTRYHIKRAREERKGTSE
jgi:hypothetical protein